jgi:hypothetical protein
MLFFAVFLSVVFLFICFVYFLRVKESDNKNKANLIRSGVRLIAYSGLLLVSLKMVDAKINFVPLLDQMCQDLLAQNKFKQYEITGCQLNQSVARDAGKVFLSSFIGAFSWLIPFIFAAVGVNVVSHGLLMPANDNEITVDKLVNKIPDRFKNAVRWFLSQLP